MNKSIKIMLSLIFIFSSFSIFSMEKKELVLFSIFSNIEPFNYTFNITLKDNKTTIPLEFKNIENKKSCTINLSSKDFPLTIIAKNNDTQKTREYTVKKPCNCNIISIEAFKSIKTTNESIKTTNDIGFRVWANNNLLN